jgi:hypothetical protein
MEVQLPNWLADGPCLDVGDIDEAYRNVPLRPL